MTPELKTMHGYAPIPVATKALLGRHHSEPVIRRQTDKSLERSGLHKPSTKAQQSSDFDNSPVNINSLAVEQQTYNSNGEADAMCITPWRRFSIRLLIFTTAIPTILGLWVARIHLNNLLYFWTERVFPRTWMALAFVLVGTQNLLLFPSFLTPFLVAKTFVAKWRPRLRLVGDDVPSIDVIVTTCREPLDIIRNTIRAALALDYPSHRYRVIVADDGRCPQLEAWVIELALKRPNLHYTARKKDGPAGYKAGNINHAVKFAEELPGGPAEFIGGLDADMIPERHWLRAVTAHIALDPRMGVVCPPQQYYNAPDNDPLIQTLHTNWRSTHIIQDMCGWAWNCGSGWVVRRRALQSIGGFPTNCLIEDVYSSILMLAEGWTSAFIPEALQYGLVPEDYASHIKQRTRWNIGGAEMALLMGFYVSRKKTKHLNVTQRILGFTNGIGAILAPIAGVVYIVATVLAFITGVHFVYFRDTEQFRLLLRLQCGMVLASWLRNCHISILTGYKGVMRDVGGISYMDPYFALTTIRSVFLPARWGGKRAAFTPTGSLTSPLHERSTTQRAPLHRRLHHTVVSCGGWMHVLVVLGLPLAAAYDAARIARQHPGGGRELWVALLTRVAWPAPQWVVVVLVFLTPLQYAVAPPGVPERDELLGRADGRGVRYPVREARETRFSLGGMRASLYYHGVLAYVLFALVASSWI